MLAPYVKSFDRKKLLKAMLPKIYSRSIIIYVCDAANFEASIVPEIFEKIEKRVLAPHATKFRVRCEHPHF